MENIQPLVHLQELNSPPKAMRFLHVWPILVYAHSHRHAESQPVQSRQWNVPASCKPAMSITMLLSRSSATTNQSQTRAEKKCWIRQRERDISTEE